MKNTFLMILVVLCFWIGTKEFTYGLVEIDDIPFNYQQSFDGLGANDVNWVDDSVLSGWFILQELGNLTLLEADSGTNVFTGRAFNYGSSQDSDRAVGARPSNVTRSFFIGAGFVNSSPATITNVQISYKGEEWRVSFDGNQQTLSFFYRVGSNDFLADTNNIGWTALPALNFTSPQILSVTGSTNLDGNAVQNSANLAQSISGISVLPGETFWIRWFDRDDPAEFDHGLAIDDVDIVFSGLGYQINLISPKQGKTLKFKSTRGFKLKGNILTTNTVTKVSYAAFTGTNTTSLTFITAPKLKGLTKGKLFKQGVKYTFDSKKNNVGKGVVSGPINLVIKIEGSQGNNAGSWSETRILSDVQIK